MTKISLFSCVCNITHPNLLNTQLTQHTHHDAHAVTDFSLTENATCCKELYPVGRKHSYSVQPADCSSPICTRVHMSLSPSCTPSYVPYPAKHTRRVGERELSEAPKVPSPTLPYQTVPCSSSGLEDNTVAASLQTEGLAVSPANLVHVLLPTLLSKRPRPKSFCGSVSNRERASLDACSRGLQPSFLFPGKHACRVRPTSAPCCPVKDSPSLYLRQAPSSAPPCPVKDSTPAPPVCFFNENISK